MGNPGGITIRGAKGTVALAWSHTGEMCGNVLVCLDASVRGKKGETRGKEGIAIVRLKKNVIVCWKEVVC